jgi:ribokinase
VAHTLANGPVVDVCVIGSANLDLVARVARLPHAGETVLGTDYAEHPGGKGLNQAVAASRSGASTAFVGAVGDDHAGQRLRHVAASEGIDVSALTTVDVPTGRALIGVDDGAENQIIVVPGANAHVTASIDIPMCRVALAQMEIATAAIVAAFGAARADGATTVLNPAPAAPLPDELIGLCDIIVPNEHELELIGGIESLMARGVTAVIVTLGADGALIVDASGSRQVPAHRVSAIDTTGAGDAFCGALAARLAAGDDLDTSVRWAVAAGALATTHEGAVPSIPRRREIESLLTAAT